MSTRAGRAQKPTNSFRSSGRSRQGYAYPEPGNPMATLGRGLPRIVCVCLGSARQLAGLNVVRRLPLQSLMEWAVVLFPVLSAAACPAPWRARTGYRTGVREVIAG